FHCLVEIGDRTERLRLFFAKGAHFLAAPIALFALFVHLGPQTRLVVFQCLQLRSQRKNKIPQTRRAPEQQDQESQKEVQRYAGQFHGSISSRGMACTRGCRTPLASRQPPSPASGGHKAARWRRQLLTLAGLPDVFSFPP